MRMCVFVFVVCTRRVDLQSTWEGSKQAIAITERKYGRKSAGAHWSTEWRKSTTQANEGMNQHDTQAEIKRNFETKREREQKREREPFSKSILCIDIPPRIIFFFFSSLSVFFFLQSL